MKKMNRLFIVLFIIFCAFSAQAEKGFDAWKENFYKRAEEQHISNEILDKYFLKATYLPRIIELDRKQPEFTTSFGNYMQRAVSDTRVEKGQKMLKEYSHILRKIEEKYGVPAHYLVAFWGIETNFGTTKGQVDILNALATLSFDTRRSEFFSEQLMTLLKILQKEKIDVPTGSWAGAFGHFQFMPTTFYQYAVDEDNNGQRDILNSFEDAVGSAANYLKKMGWKRGESWGRQVILSDELYLRAEEKHPLKDWVKWGIKRADGCAYLSNEMDLEAKLLLPEGIKGPAFLVYKNFDVIKRWNRSDFYALAIGVLADKIAQKNTLNVKKINILPNRPKDDIKLLQKVLKKEGLYDGNIDGIIGSSTKDALKNYQKKNGFVADGFLSEELLNNLREKGKQ